MGKNVRSALKGIIIGFAAAVLLCFAAFSGLWYFSGGDPVGLIAGLFGVAPAGQASEVPPGKIKIYSAQGRAADTVTDSMIRAEDVTAAGALYDGDSATAASGTATLDAGEPKTLAYIRFMPDVSSEKSANLCVGTRFLASKDNVNFCELGTVMPDTNGSVNPDWHTVEFSGFGCYRYFRTEIPEGGSLGEVEWICDNDITVGDNGTLSIRLTAFEAAESFSGETVLAVYSRDGILKHYEVLSGDFLPEEYYNIEFADVPAALGDQYIVDVYDCNAGASALSAPLVYRYTESSPRLSMANVYSDNMLLQADEDLVIYGAAPIGARVRGEIENTDTGELYAGTAVSGADGWEINFGAFKNGGNYNMSVTDGEDKLEFKNVTFGDVWLFAGQSNMDFYLSGEKASADMLKTSAGKKRSDNSGIRLLNMYNIGTQGAVAPITDVPLNEWNEFWAPLTPDRATYLSAVSYYFALGINERYGRNVGIISSAVGDTEINLWYPRGEKNGSFTGTDGALYNNRVYPFTKLKIKGILWYQGEADQYRTNMNAEQYSDAMAGLINTYRDKWNRPDLPFYYVQLARYGTKDESEIREGQRVALQKVRVSENLGMFSLLDVIGNYEQEEGCARIDIHPWQKQLVAERYLNFAGHDLYGDREINTTGPRYRSMEIKGDTIELTFEHTGSLRIMDSSCYADSVCDERIRDNPREAEELQEFWICGSDSIYYPAKANIIGDKVVVYSENVPEPQNVMYAWGAYPEMPNLTDDTGLPAFTFCTEDGSEFM